MSFKKYVKQLNETSQDILDLVERVLITAENDGDSYRKKDVKGALRKASQVERKVFEDDLGDALKMAEKQLKKDWK